MKLLRKVYVGGGGGMGADISYCTLFHDVVYLKKPSIFFFTMNASESGGFYTILSSHFCNVFTHFWKGSKNHVLRVSGNATLIPDISGE